jgi:hypothetical protein
MKIKICNNCRANDFKMLKKGLGTLGSPTLQRNAILICKAAGIKGLKDISLMMFVAIGRVLN